MEHSVLPLSGDGPINAPSVAEHLAVWAGDDFDRKALAALINRIAEASVPLAARLALGRLPGDPGAVVGVNETGDRQKSLDLAAQDNYVRALSDVSVARILSEEASEVIVVDQHGQFDVAMDPVDGSGSIGVGAPLGALFCVFPAGDSFRRSGRDIIAAAYLSFGHSVDIGFSTGDGVTIATLDSASGLFRVDQTHVRIAPETGTVAFNASNLRRWKTGLRRYVEDLLLGSEGPRGRDFNMRWIAAAVGDLHRILRQGGTFMYPGDDRPGRAHGFLRLAYEAFPIAFLIEQAGGAATDGTRAILELTPSELHSRVPLFFGSRDEVATLHDYLAEPIS